MVNTTGLEPVTSCSRCLSIVRFLRTMLDKAIYS
nr:MAG TPA: hypothetical protein [Caudoviricetes sp.]